MDFKVGDKVRVKARPELRSEFLRTWAGSGGVVTKVGLTPTSLHQVQMADGSHHLFYASELQRVRR